MTTHHTDPSRGDSPENVDPSENRPNREEAKRAPIILNNGEYTIREKPNGCLEALRYGEPWRDLTGDNLILALADRMEAFDELLIAAQRALAGFQLLIAADDLTDDEKEQVALLKNAIRNATQP